MKYVQISAFILALFIGTPVKSPTTRYFSVGYILQGRDQGGFTTGLMWVTRDTMVSNSELKGLVRDEYPAAATITIISLHEFKSKAELEKFKQ